MPNPTTLEDIGGINGGDVLKRFLAASHGDTGNHREKDLLTACGFAGGLGIFSNAQAGLTPTSQAVYGVATYMYSGETVTNILVNVQTAAAGTAPTAIKLGVWSSAATPVCLAVTADLSADARWTSQGWKENALTAPLTVPATGVYYMAFWKNGAFSVTDVQLNAPGAVGPPGTPAGSYPRIFGTVKSGATTMAVNDTGAYGAAPAPVIAWN